MMNKLNLRTWNVSSVLIVFALPSIILISLPGFLIDGFILLGFISSALLLIITLENIDPLRITFLPTIVLLLTTFRLLLSIATTRNIIANEGVGDIIEAVGYMVMGGNLISGLLIFIIITIVQFMVITKGGERVAEVGARFSLDALPGRQMTIDGDLKSNLITPEEAQKLRDDLSTENKLFGSLDGAMKFIKGDSIAGILISLVNLFGGIYVGINHFEYSLSESVLKFSVLTIGDGLVSQIPSLLLSLACGVYLTRIKSNADKATGGFIDQLLGQISIFWKSVIFVGVFIIGISFFDMTLFYITLPIGLLCFVLTFFLALRALKEGDVDVEEGKGIYENLKIILKDASYKSIVSDIRESLSKKLWGQELGAPVVDIDLSLENDIEFYISDILVYKFSHSESSSQKIIKILSDDFFLFNEEIEKNIRNIVFYFMNSQLISKYNLQFTDDILKGVATDSEVIKNEIDAAIGLNRVHDVIKQMLMSPEFYLDRITFFESMIYWSRVENESNLWFVRIRPQAKYEITSRVLNKEQKVYIVFLDQDLLEYISSSNTSQEKSTDQDISYTKHVRAELERITLQFDCKPVIVVHSQDITEVLSFFKKISSTIPVCSQEDLVGDDIIAGSETVSLS